MQSVSMEKFNHFLRENEGQRSILQSAGSKEEFIGLYVRQGNEFLQSTGLPDINSSDLEAALEKDETLTHISLSDLEASRPNFGSGQTCCSSTKGCT